MFSIRIKPIIEDIQITKDYLSLTAFLEDEVKKEEYQIPLGNNDPYEFFDTNNQSEIQKSDHLNSFYSNLIDRKPEPTKAQLMRQLAERDRQLARYEGTLQENRQLKRQLAAHSRELKRYKSKEVAAIEQRKAAGKSSATQRQATIKSRNQTWIEEAKRLSSKKGGTSVAKDIRKSKLGLKPESFERYSWQTIYQAIKGHLQISF